MDQLLNYNLLELVSSDWADRVAEGLLETTSLPHKGRGKVYIYLIVPVPHYTVYVVTS